MEENSVNKESIQTTISSKFRLSWFYKNIYCCSVKRLYLLEKYSVNYNKFFSVGAIDNMIGVMIFIFGGYALYRVFNNIEIALLFGIICGILRFSFDRYLVSSLINKITLKVI